MPLSELDAVIECPPITPVPAAPEWLLGVAAYKGAPLSVIDLAAACGERAPPAPAGGKRLLLVEAGRHRVAFSVDA
ncbi:MAG: chemotaxis protein CheW, partial [Gammaproteobacteria bacterium]|nr:chemotaxis protein CheW [Gammaproteobacteria bacterium]